MITLSILTGFLCFALVFALGWWLGGFVFPAPAMERRDG